MLDRMDREGARFTHADSTLNDNVLTDVEELDWEAAKQAAHSRRWVLLDSLAKAERRAYKPRRT